MLNFFEFDFFDCRLFMVGIVFTIFSTILCVHTEAFNLEKSTF